MKEQTKVNLAPAWLLTEIAVEKGRELAKKYECDEEVVVAALYLAHTKFDRVWGGPVQQKHPELSAEFVKKYLDEWNVSGEKQDMILNAILAHHDKVPTKSKEAEVMKNAECYKFITVKGSLILLHELGIRGVPYKEAALKVIQKMEQKLLFLTLDECVEDGKNNKKEILGLFAE